MLYNGHIFTNQDGEQFKRINKREARNRAARGESIGVCACNIDPVNPYWHYMSWYHPAGEQDAFDGYDTFDAFVNAYEYYNCLNRQTGHYASYYVEVKPC